MLVQEREVRRAVSRGNVALSRHETVVYSGGDPRKEQ